MLGDDDLELTIRKGSPSVKLTRDEFRERFRAQFFDPAFERVTTELDAVEEVAWESSHLSHIAGGAAMSQ